MFPRKWMLPVTGSVVLSHGNLSTQAWRGRGEGDLRNTCDWLSRAFCQPRRLDLILWTFVDNMSNFQSDIRTERESPQRVFLGSWWYLGEGPDLESGDLSSSLGSAISDLIMWDSSLPPLCPSSSISTVGWLEVPHQIPREEIMRSS